MSAEAHLSADARRPAGPPWSGATGLLGGRWLSAMIGRPPGEPVYFTARDRAGRAAGTLGYWITDPEAYPAFNWFDLVWATPAVYPGLPDAGPGPPRTSAFPALTLVQPGYDCTAHGDPELLGDLVHGVLDWAHERGAAAVSALYAHGAFAAALRDAGFAAYRTAERAVLTGPGSWPSTLSRNGRKQVASDLRVLEARGVRFGPEPLGDDLAEEILPLRRALVRKYGGYVAPEADRATLDGLLDAYRPADLRVFTARDDEGLAGFSLFVADEPGRWSSFWVGTGSDRAYFACLFYAPIAAARANGTATLDLGLGLDTAKSRRGCHGEPRAVYVRAADPAAAPADHPRALPRQGNPALRPLVS